METKQPMVRIIARKGSAARQSTKETRRNNWLLLAVAIIGFLLMMVVLSSLFGRPAAVAVERSAQPPGAPDAPIPMNWQEANGIRLTRDNDGRIRDPRNARDIPNPRSGHISNDGYVWLIPAPDTYDNGTPKEVRYDEHGVWGNPNHSMPAVPSPYRSASSP